jgi:2-keto-4-pentenoate hydratase/2-oxohepta-3-ene-1,7-dioic acid hydratase in catechol pathway
MTYFISATSPATLRRIDKAADTWVKDGRDTLRLSKVRLLAPIPRPRKNIFCMGRNYVEHTREGGHPVPEAPPFFTKPPTAVIGPDSAIVAHGTTKELDYEVELAVVIGRGGRNISARRALEHVFGYTIMNDVSARDLQHRHLQWFKGKSLDTFAPLGPWIVPQFDIPDPQALRITLRVNGETRQNSNTSEMVFSVARLIEALSAGMTLEPGDLLATGTPGGVGMGFTPPKWLRPGDVIEAEVERVGILRNHVVPSEP